MGDLTLKVADILAKDGVDAEIRNPHQLNP